MPTRSIHSITMSLRLSHLVVLFALLASVSATYAVDLPLKLQKEDHVVLVGNTLALGSEPPWHGAC